MADNRCNEIMSSSSSPSTTTASSSPMIDTNNTSNSNDSKVMNGNRNSFNAPKYGTPVPNRVFVGGIPTDTNETEVKQLFAKYGTVVSVKIINDRAGVPRGYGFVTYESEDDAKRVMKESDNLLIKGRKLNVSVAVKRQQHYSNDLNSRVVTSGSIYYNPYLMSANSLYPDFGIYSSEGIPLYNLGINPQLLANSGGHTAPATQNPYPYTYQTSGLYLTTQPSLAPQLAPQFQSSQQSSTYPLVSTSYRLPLNSQNVGQNLNVSQMNPYLQLSNATTPPLSQSSSLQPIQYSGTVANPMMNTDCGHNMGRAVNTAMSHLNLYQPSLYTISSNIGNTNQPMACVQNVQLKADNTMNLCSDNSSLMPAHNPVSSQQMVELLPVWPQRVPNIQSPPINTALNGYQYSSKSQQSSTTTTPDNSGAVKDRRNNSSNSSYNTSHYRKAVNNSNNRSAKPNNSYGQQNRNPNYTNAADNECQNGRKHESAGAHHSTAPNTSALQGLPFVKHYSNTRYHTMPVSQALLNNYQPSPQPKHNSTCGGGPGNGGTGQPWVTKMVNGVQINVLANYSVGDGVDGYGNPLTPPLTPGAHHHSAIKSVHK